MAKIALTVNLPGGDDALVVAPKSTPESLVFGKTAKLVLAVQNRSPAALVFPEISAVTDGPVKHKAGASALQTALTVPAGQTVDLTINIEPKEPIFKGETMSIVVTGTSG